MAANPTQPAAPTPRMLTFSFSGTTSQMPAPRLGHQGEFSPPCRTNREDSTQAALLTGDRRSSSPGASIGQGSEILGSSRPVAAEAKILILVEMPPPSSETNPPPVIEKDSATFPDCYQGNAIYNGIQFINGWTEVSSAATTELLAGDGSDLQRRPGHSTGSVSRSLSHTYSMQFHLYWSASQTSYS